MTGRDTGCAACLESAQMVERASAPEELLSADSIASAGASLTLRIAVLDRDSGFLAVLGKRLERAGWEYRVLASSVAPETIVPMRLGAIVVDLAVIGPTCWEWLERLCAALPELGVVVCTGSSTVAQRVRGLRLGADDWLSKPCHPEELMARVEAVTFHRRRPEPRALEPVLLGEVEVRPDQYQAFVNGDSLRLTRREYQLIELMSRAGPEVLAREQIYECLWGYEMARNDRSVDVFVHKLRRKLERASPDWRYLHTHFGIGYRLAAERVEGSSVHELRAAEALPSTRLAA